MLKAEMGRSGKGRKLSQVRGREHDSGPHGKGQPRRGLLGTLPGLGEGLIGPAWSFMHCTQTPATKAERDKITF